MSREVRQLSPRSAEQLRSCINRGYKKEYSTVKLKRSESLHWKMELNRMTMQHKEHVLLFSFVIDTLWCHQVQSYNENAEWKLVTGNTDNLLSTLYTEG